MVDDFTLLKGVRDVVSVPPSKFIYVSLPAASFKPHDNTATYLIEGPSWQVNSEGVANTDWNAPVIIPDGYKVVEAVVFGSATDETWTMYRTNRLGSNAEAMASALVGVVDTSITAGTVDNLNYSYIFFVIDYDDDEALYGARIKLEYVG